MLKFLHKFVSPKTDGPDSTLLKPSNWNDEHAFTTTLQSIWVGRDPSGPGALQEFPVENSGPTDDFTMMTKSQIEAAIAAAVGTIDTTSTGDLSASFVSAKPKWLLLNGQTIGPVGSSATFASAAAKDLFTLMWGLNTNSWPVDPSRGASADADWTAGTKKIALPDARGCTMGMMDLGAGVNALLVSLGLKIGADKVSLGITNIPSHTHPPAGGGRVGYNASIGGGGGGSSLWDAGPVPITGPTGGDPAAVPPYSTTVPVPIIPPTLGVNLFIKL
jgi:hypothetical protein